jgi:hypothetical protein
VVLDSHHSEEEQNPDPDPHSSEKLNPDSDPHLNDADLQPYNRIRSSFAFVSRRILTTVPLFEVFSLQNRSPRVPFCSVYFSQLIRI